MQGQMLWVHYPPSPTDATPLIARLRACRASGVLLKYHDGNSATDNTGYNYQAVLRALVGPLKAAGFTVAAWGYWYPGDSPSAIAGLVQQAVADGAEWYCADAEAEFEVANAASLAAAILSAIRQVCPSLHLAYAPLPYADVQSAFPYSTFDAACQLCLPQIYWADLGDSWGAAYNRCWSSFSAAGLIGNGHASWQPIGQADNGATAADVEAFAAACHGNGAQPIPGISWWVLDDQPTTIDAALAASPYAVVVSPKAAPDVATALADLAQAEADEAKAQAEIAAAKGALGA